MNDSINDSIKQTLLRGVISFGISAFAGTLVNCLIDCIVNATGKPGFISMSPDYVSLFPTPVIAAYVNVILYGLIGATFSIMTLIYEVERIGFLLQSVIYFVTTSAVCIAITTVIWQLHHYPEAMICTLLGYAGTHVIIMVMEYRKLKKDIALINAQVHEIEI